MIDPQVYDRTHSLSASELHHMQLLSHGLSKARRDGTRRPDRPFRDCCDRSKTFSTIWEQ